MLKLSKRGVLTGGIVVALATATIACLSGCKTPSFGNEISASQEQQIGREEAAQLEGQCHVLHSADINGPVQEVAAAIQPLAMRLNPNELYQVQVLDTEEENAFSLPGGWIYIDKGLLGRIGMDREMIGALIAHEAAHVALRHSIDRLSDAYGKAAMVDLLTRGGYQEAAEMALQLDMTNHSRDEEDVADALGVKMAASAGFDPAGLIKLIKTLQVPEPSLQCSEWLGTHPVTAARMRHLTQLLQKVSSR